MKPHTNIKLQNFALAVRQQMGFPMFAAANESVKFTAGGELDLFRQIQTAALAQEMSRDFIYFGWRSVSAKAPTSIAVLFREELLVDFIDGCTLWAADAEAPLILINERHDEHFVRGARGALERRTGLPALKLAAGKRLAMQRVHRAFAAMGDEVLANNRFVPHGEPWADHKPQAEPAVVRLV